MSINLKNMRRLRAHLRSRKNPVGFDMRAWFRHNGRQLVSPAAICRAAEEHACGTVACLAGHAALLAWQSGDVPKKRNAKVVDVATKWLELDVGEVQRLFHGLWPAVLWSTIPADITKALAITELTRMIDEET